MKVRIALFLLGLLLGSLFTRSTEAQQAVVAFVSNGSGVLVPVSVTAAGNINVVSH